MASVRDIASAAGVSAATVSRVINNHPTVSDDVREKVLAAANGLRYVAKVGRRSTTNIAFVYTGESSLGSPFDASLMYGMGTRMDEFGFDLMILNTARARQPDETFTQMFMRKGIRGAVLRTTTRTRVLCEQIAAEGFPAVVVGDRFDDNKRVSYIHGDSRSSSRDAVAHLIGLGHRRVGVCVNLVDDTDHRDRVSGYREAHEAAGLAVDERLVVRTPANRPGGVQVMRRLLAMSAADRPTAVYFADPMAAVGAMNEAAAAGLRVPEDLSVVGFDDAEVRFLVHPHMTSVVQDAARIGQAAFEALNDLIEQPGRPQPVRRALPAQFEVHRSTAPPRPA
jgi:DNA-binding LacI/PurR family transcriptional regulator